LHAYASDSLDRRIVPWVIAVTAVGIAYFYAVVTEAVGWSLPWWCEVPSILGVYGLLYWVYDSWGWKWAPCGLRLSQIPDCGGTWYGEINSTHAGGTKGEGMLIVHQTWMRILLEFRTDSSGSFSRMAAMNVRPGPSQGLIYEYANEPRATATGTMHAHRGFTFLKLSADGEWLEGDYYSGRDRAKQGTLRLRRVSRRPLGLAQAKRAFPGT
jgi:hypothetical protein